MTLNKMWLAIADAIAQHTHRPINPQRVTPVSGGDINQNYVLQAEGQAYFVKINHQHHQLFVAEAQALEQIQATQTIRVPAVIAQGIEQQAAYLVLEALPLSASPQHSHYALGQQLAQLHRAPVQQFPGGLYGWQRANFIGHSLQDNRPRCAWAEFWRENRLKPQLAMAYANGFAGALQPYEKDLLARSDTLLADHCPAPSLVHGDLWSGNAACLADSTPVIFDPASYYGDREVDLAMTELFGGFSPEFYRGYADSWPLQKGYEKRKSLYNLYHMLNHLNLFGGGYCASCITLIDRVLA